MMELQTLLEALCPLSGVSSREEAVRSYLLTQCETCADAVRTDRLGNLYAFKRGKDTSKTVTLTAHMDEIGVMVTDYTSDGFLRFDPVGEADVRTLMGKRVYLGEDGIMGVFGVKPIHLTPRPERKICPKVDTLYIDIGAKDAKTAKKLAPLGTVGVFAPEVLPFGNGLLKAKALGGRSGCAILLKLLEEELPVNCVFAFTVQNEVGARGAFGAAFSEEPELLINLDGCSANDLPNVDEEAQICHLRKGAVIRVADRGTLYDRELVTLCQKLAAQEGISAQTVSENQTKTDVMAVQRVKKGCKAIGLAIPVRYQQSPSCVAALEDIWAVYRLTSVLLRKFATNPAEEA